jgi:nitronate monooxygenase
MGAPMADVSGGALAAATAKGGGFGFVAAGHLRDFEGLRREIDIFKQLSATTSYRNNLGIGFIGYSSMANGNTDRVLQVIEEHRPFAVQFFAPAVVGDNVKEAQALGSLVMAQVGSEEHAQEALEAGVDCIIVQGREAGGHGLRPELAIATFSLASSILEMVKSTPAADRPSVLAAGGIADGKGLAAALALGCDGVVFGTRLYASHEAMGHNSFKQRLATATVSDVLRTRTFDTIMNTGSPNPWPEPFDSVGCVQNDTTKRWELQPIDNLIASLSSDPSILQIVVDANIRGDIDIGLVHAGASVAKINAVESATQIIERSEQEALHIIQEQLPLLCDNT